MDLNGDCALCLWADGRRMGVLAQPHWTNGSYPKIGDLRNRFLRGQDDHIGVIVKNEQ